MYPQYFVKALSRYRKLLEAKESLTRLEQLDLDYINDRIGGQA